MRHLDDGDFEAAAEMFATDAIYSRVGADADGNPLPSLDVIEGRSNILKYFRARGPRPYRHDIWHVVSDGRVEMIAGVVEGGPEAAMLASASVDDGGLITRYVGLASNASEAVREAIKAYGGTPADPE